MEQDPHWWSMWRNFFTGGTPCWSWRRAWGGKNIWDNWLLAEHNPHSSIPLCSSGRGGREIVSVIMGRTEGWRVGPCYFFNWCCFLSSYSTFNGKKPQKTPNGVFNMKVTDEWSCPYLDSQAFPSSFLFLSCWGGGVSEWHDRGLGSQPRSNPPQGITLFIAIFLALFFKRVLIFFIDWSWHTTFQAHFSTLIAAQNILNILAQNRANYKSYLWVILYS